MTIAIDCRVLDSSGIGVFLRECLIRFNSQNVSLLLIGSAEKIRKLSLKKSTILECNIKTFSLKELFCFPKSLLKQINVMLILLPTLIFPLELKFQFFLQYTI